MTEDLGSLTAGWPVPHVAAAVVADGQTVATVGDLDWVTRLASISKPLSAYAGLIAVEEGTITLDQPAGRPGATVRHLLAHAAGYAFDSPDLIAGVEARRIYSNTGIEVFADHVAAAAGMPFGDYMREAVFESLGMGSTDLRGSPAHAVYSSVADLLFFVGELRKPTLINRAALDEATTVQYPSLAGVVPGVGRFDPNPWGLGFELKGNKQGHWTGSLTSNRTFGHFGGAGTFLWVDPVADMAVIALTNREFGAWALEAWPRFSDEVLRRFAGDRSGR